MLGVLAMIFAVLAFAEKTREDGHLPERNSRSPDGMTYPGVATGLVTVLIPVSRAVTGEVKPLSGHPALPLSGGMRCPPVS